MHNDIAGQPLAFVSAGATKVGRRYATLFGERFASGGQVAVVIVAGETCQFSNFVECIVVANFRYPFADGVFAKMMLAFNLFLTPHCVS